MLRWTIASWQSSAPPAEMPHRLVEVPGHPAAQFRGCFGLRSCQERVGPPAGEAATPPTSLPSVPSSCPEQTAPADNQGTPPELPQHVLRLRPPPGLNVRIGDPHHLFDRGHHLSGMLRACGVGSVFFLPPISRLPQPKSFCCQPGVGGPHSLRPICRTVHRAIDPSTVSRPPSQPSMGLNHGHTLHQIVFMGDRGNMIRVVFERHKIQVCADGIQHALRLLAKQVVRDDNDLAAANSPHSITQPVDAQPHDAWIRQGNGGAAFNRLTEIVIILPGLVSGLVRYNLSKLAMIARMSRTVTRIWMGRCKTSSSSSTYSSQPLALSKTRFPAVNSWR